MHSIARHTYSDGSTSLILGALVEHRTVGTRARVRSVERWPDGRVRCVWVVDSDGLPLDVAIGCWRRFWRPVR